MDSVRRVTLRCLVEDLVSDWSDVSQQRQFAELRDSLKNETVSDGDIALKMGDLPTTSLAAHPLVTSFNAAFSSDSVDVQRESISGLTNPHWWKQKTSRWRGAATDSKLAGEGEIWLCAGGMRAQGDAKDFYAGFCSTASGGGHSHYLPGNDDKRLQQVELKVLRKAAWLEQVKLATMVSVAGHICAGGGGLLHLPSPSPESIQDPLLHVTIASEIMEDDGERLVEVFLEVELLDRSKRALGDAATAAMKSVLEPREDSWTIALGKDETQIWSTLLSEERIELANQAVSTGKLPEKFRDAATILAVQAHYAPVTGLVEAMVEGDPVRSLCGQWFVPTADPEPRPVCSVCNGLHQKLPE